jgi:hypothetical protein
MASTGIRALDRLKKAANLVPVKKTVILADSTEFVFYRSPLTMAERERAQKDAASDDVNAFALQLLIQKATDENGQRIFAAGEIAELKNEVRDADLQSLMLAVISEDIKEEVDTKK